MLGWGVGGIEAEAAMLGQPVTMLIPQVIGFKLTGSLPAGTTATDLVLTVTEMLRKNGVVDKFVEFFGDGLQGLPLADRATIANMSPEFGSTCAIFPIDEETIRYLRTHRPARGADRAGRGLRQGAGSVAHQRRAGRRLHRCGRTRSVDGRTHARRTQAPAGSGAAAHRQERLPSKHQERMAEERTQKNPTATGSAPASVDGKTFELQRWRGADRRDHQLHQHLESLRAGGRRTAGAQCASPRARTPNPG